MGVVYIKEENPFAEFLKGVSPVVDAWGDRYLQRDIVNLLKDYQKYTDGVNKAESRKIKQNGDEKKNALNSQLFFNVRNLRELLEKSHALSVSPQENHSQGIGDFFKPKFGQLSTEPSFRHKKKRARSGSHTAPINSPSQATSAVSCPPQAHGQSPDQEDAKRTMMREELMRRGASVMGAYGMMALLDRADW